jgi:hypothetical protein
MSRLQRTLVALLTVSTVLFAVGVIAERSDADSHAEPAAQIEQSGEPAGTEDAHDESAEAAAGAETAAGEPDEDERLLGVDLESTPLIVLAVLAGLGLAVLTASRLGHARGVLLAVAVAALAWAVLDVREVLHQLDESRTTVAVLAMIVAVLHLAAAMVSGRLARRPTAAAP